MRSLRRATFRSSRHGARDLKRRRADFERVVKFHQIHLRDMKEQQALDSSLTEDSVELSQDDVSLTSQWAHDILEEALDPMRNNMRALLLRLQSTCNLTEANESASNVELSGKPPSDDEDIRGLAEALVTERFMSHEGEHVKLLVACCLAEIMRVCAPEPPIPERKLNQVCALFIEQLAVLSAKEDPAETFRFSLLEQLATVKTFVVFSDDDEVICDICACFYAVVKPHQSDKVKQYGADILISLLEEADNLSTAALDAMLAPFVSAYGYSEDAIALAARVLHGASSFIQVPLSSLLNASIQELHSAHGLSTPRKGGHGRKSPSKRKYEENSDLSAKEHSEHHEHMQDLIVAINNVAPDVLVYVIPNLEDGLTSKDVTRRLACATLLGRLFTSRGEVANSYPSLFAEFLSRGRDENAEVRATVTTTLGRLMKLHPKHREHIDELFRNRVFDRSESVRIAAVRSIGRAGDGPSDALLKMHATRLRDKKHSIRQTTADAVNELYTADVQPQEPASQLGIGQKLGQPGNINKVQNQFETTTDGNRQDEAGLLEGLESRTFRLSWLPNTLVESMLAVDGVGDYETGRRIEKIMLFDIPALNCKNASRVTFGLRQLCIFLSHLSDGAHMTLCTRLRDRWRIRNKVMAFIEHRLSSKRKKQTEQQNLEDVDEVTPSAPPQKLQDEERSSDNRLSPGDVERLAVTLSACIRRRHSITGDSVGMCNSLFEVADLKCFEALERSISCNSTFQDFSREKQDALSRAGLTSSALSFWSDIVIPDCFPGVLSASFFSYATKIAIEESKEQDDMDPSAAERSLSVLRGVLRFLELFGVLAKEVLVYASEDIQSLCEIRVNGSVARAEVLLCGLRLVSRIPGKRFGKLADDSFWDKLKSLMVCNKLVSVERGSALAKAAARAAIHLQNRLPESEEALTELGNSLVFELDSFSGDPESIVAPLTALTQFAKYAPRNFKVMSLGCFDFSRGILSGALNAKIEAAGQNDDSKEARSPRHKTNETLTPIFGRHTDELSKSITVPEHLCRASVVQQATKLIAYSLPYLEDEELSGVIKVLLNVAFEKRGRVFGVKYGDDSDYEDQETAGSEPSSSHVMYAACRLFAGRAISFLAGNPKFLRNISPDVLCSALLLLQDENASVRMCFAKKICDCIMKKRLPLRWVVGLALMAVDPNRKNIGHVKALLSSVFRHRRRIYEQAKRESHKTSLVLLPEGTVPELIWVLANLPDVEMDEANGYQESEKCLQFFLDRLLETNEHAGILHEYIESLSIAQVVNEDEDSGPGPCTRRIIELGQIAAAILKKKQAGRKWNLAEHPGRVALPRDMFRIVNRKAETSGVQPVSLVQVARRFDEGAQGGSAKKTPAETVLEPELSSVERKQKETSTTKQRRLQRTSSGSSRKRSSEKKRSSLTLLETRISEETESPPKRPRFSPEKVGSQDHMEADNDSELRNSELTGQSEGTEKQGTGEDEAEVSNDLREKDGDASEPLSKQQTIVSSGRKQRVKKRPRAPLRSGAVCTVEAKTKLTRVRRSARNRGP